MRQLESYLVYASLYVVWSGRAPLAYECGLVVAALLLAHLVIELPRWQLAGLYVQMSWTLHSLWSSPSAWPASALFIGASTAALLVHSALACLFPVAPMPELRGRFRSIGVVSRWLDTTLAREWAAKGSLAAGEDVATAPLRVLAWYPAATTPSAKRGAPFMSLACATGLAEFVAMPRFLFSYLPLARTRAVTDAALDASVLRDAPLPVLVMSHGMGGSAEVYTTQCSELASQGFVVISLTHNDGSACLAEQPDGAHIRYSSLEEGPDRARQLRQRAGEVQFVLDALERFEAKGGSGWPTPPPPFAGKLDLSRVGLVGHSFGGASVLRAASDEVQHHPGRVRAVVGNDAWCEVLPRDVVGRGLRGVPALITLSDAWVNEYENNMRDVTALLGATQPEAVLTEVPKTKHSNFSDAPLFSPWLARRMGAIGQTDFADTMRVINHAQTAFFQTYLPCRDDYRAQAAREEHERMFGVDSKLSGTGIRILMRRQEPNPHATN